ncbi:hypothetical protein [Actinoplanes sp. NPDC049118]
MARRGRREPQLLEVVVEPDPAFDPITQEATLRKPSRDADRPA